MSELKGFSGFQATANPFKPNQENVQSDAASKPSGLFGNSGGFSLLNTNSNANAGSSLFSNQNKNLFEPAKAQEKSASQDGTNATTPQLNVIGAGASNNSSSSGPFSSTNIFGQPPKSTGPSMGGTGGLSLFGKSDASAENKKEDETAKAANPAAATSSDQPSSSSAKADNSAKASTPSQGGLFGSATSTTKASDPQKKDGIAPKDNPAQPILPPSTLRGKTIEEIVNKWSAELEQHVKEFNLLVNEVSVWDRALIDNGNTIAALLQHLTLAEQEHNDVDQLLNHIEQQQKELNSTLDVYEKSAKDLFQGQSGSLRALDIGPADAERDKNYSLATELNTHLDDLSQSLLQMIETVNSFTDFASDDQGTKTKTEDPLQQISQILSSHLESLEWIDGAVREVENKVVDAEKRVREASAGAPSTGFGLSNGSRHRGFKLAR